MSSNKRQKIEILGKDLTEDEINKLTKNESRMYKWDIPYPEHYFKVCIIVFIYNIDFF